MLWRVEEITHPVPTFAMEGCVLGLSSSHSFIYKIFILFLAAPSDILVPWPGIGPVPPELVTWSLKYWTTREVPLATFLKIFLFQCLLWVSPAWTAATPMKQCPAPDSLWHPICSLALFPLIHLNLILLNLFNADPLSTHDLQLP